MTLDFLPVTDKYRQPNNIIKNCLRIEICKPRILLPTNGMDLTEAEDIKKRGQKDTEELYKKELHDPDNHDGVITHQEPDILECEVKWALKIITMNKDSGGDAIPVGAISNPER